MTSVDVAQGAFGPVNQFNNERSPNTASSTAVVAPGATSLSSIAWLDLTAEPMVLHVPAVKDHHYVLALIDPYTENLRNFSDASGTKPGDYVIAGPGQQGATVPSGAERVDVDATRIWIIGSTQLKGADDVAAVNAIQDGYTLTPLSKFGAAYQPPEPANPVTTVTQAAIPTGLAFFDTLGQLLVAFPPPEADAPELAKLATVGIGPGRTPSTDVSLSADTVKGLTDAVADGPAAIQADVQQLYKADFARHGGYLLGGFGSYGTDYTKRAVIATVGLGAFLPQQAIYAMAWSDATGKPLDGSSSYVLHMAAVPPSQEGWSVTVYDLKGGLEANALDRYALHRHLEPREERRRIDRHHAVGRPAGGCRRTAGLAADHRRTGVRADVAAVRPQPERDQRHPRRERLAAAGDHRGGRLSASLHEIEETP